MLGKLYIHSQGRGKVNLLGFSRAKKQGRGGEEGEAYKKWVFPSFSLLCIPLGKCGV